MLISYREFNSFQLCVESGHFRKQRSKLLFYQLIDTNIYVIPGIGPDFQHTTNHSDNPQQDPASVREFLISAYEKNISTRLKIELCSSDMSSYNYKEASARKFSSLSLICNLERDDLSAPKCFNAFTSADWLLIEQSRDSGNDLKSEKWCTTWWHQFKILLLRGLRERRFEAFNKLRIFQVLSVAILGGLLWWQTPLSHIDDRVSFYTIAIMFPLYVSAVQLRKREHKRHKTGYNKVYVSSLMDLASLISH